MADLMQELSAHGRDFNFFQAVSLLEESLADRFPRGAVESGQIRFAPDPSIGFPPNDVVSVTAEPDGVKFLLAFMGLVGVSSPLPIYFSEYISRKPEKAGPLLDFLSMFNHRMYTFFYQAWKKYNFIRTFRPDAGDPFTRQIALLSGITPAEALTRERVALLAYAGVLAGSSRSRAGLETVLTDSLGGLPVRVREFVPRWVPLTEVPPLGAEARLGINAIAGTSIYDLGGKFRIAIGPLRRDVYETFLPGSEKIARVKAIVDSYLSAPLDYDIEVQLQSIDLVPVILGGDNTRLGETSALGQSHGRTDIHAIVIS